MNETESTQVIPHLFGENHIRHTLIDGEPWFIAQDVCAILGLENVSRAVNGAESGTNLGLDPDERADLIINQVSSSRSATEHTQRRRHLIVNESGLYRLIFKSRKAEAKAFQRWVFREVLPAIRRTGMYSPRETALIGFCRELLGMGMGSKDVSILARSAFPPLTRAEKIAQFRAFAPPAEPEPVDPEFEAFLGIMKPGQSYGISEFFHALPPGHRIRTIQSERGRHTAVGAICGEMVRRRLLQKVDGSRLASYVLPSNVVSIQEQ